MAKTHTYIVLSALFLFFNCKQTEKQTEEQPVSEDKIVYDMYEPSEMALLMEYMYAYNQGVKQAILDGRPVEEFPLEFLKIHSAEFTKASDRNETFNSFAKQFIEAEKSLYNPDLKTPLKERFNTTVNLCIACHQTSCTGPIPRIKKLLIQ